MGWAFRADIARSSITGAMPYTGLVGGIGAHGWNGTWLVDGAASGLVTIDIDPPAQARVLGVPLRLWTLIVSVDWPDGLIASLTDGGVDHQGQHH